MSVDQVHIMHKMDGVRAGKLSSANAFFQQASFDLSSAANAMLTNVLELKDEPDQILASVGLFRKTLLDQLSGPEPRARRYLSSRT